MTADPSRLGDSTETIFPYLYQAHHREYLEDIPFWLDLAKRQGDPILELGCGTGRVLIPLAEAGFKCYGLDHNQGMLALLQKQLPTLLSENIHVIQEDLTQFQVDIRFPLILLPCNTYSTLPEKGRKSALGCIFKHLVPGGVFATSIPNPEILHDLRTAAQSEIETFFPHPFTGNPVQVSYWIERKVENITFHWYYDHLHPDGKVERLSLPICHYLSTNTQYVDEFHKAGFSIQEIYGNYDHSPYGPLSPNMIIIAQKF